MYAMEEEQPQQPTRVTEQVELDPEMVADIEDIVQNEPLKATATSPAPVAEPTATKAPEGQTEAPAPTAVKTVVKPTVVEKVELPEVTTETIGDVVTAEEEPVSVAPAPPAP